MENTFHSLDTPKKFACHTFFFHGLFLLLLTGCILKLRLIRTWTSGSNWVTTDLQDSILCFTVDSIKCWKKKILVISWSVWNQIDFTFKFLFCFVSWFWFSETTVKQIEEAFKEFTTREDIAIVLISQYVSHISRL